MNTAKLIIIYIVLFVVTSLLSAYFTQYVFGLHHYYVDYWTALVTNWWLAIILAYAKSSKK